MGQKSELMLPLNIGKTVVPKKGQVEPALRKEQRGVTTKVPVHSVKELEYLLANKLTKSQFAMVSASEGTRISYDLKVTIILS